MSRHSAKSAGRSTKTARSSAKKTTKTAGKSARGVVKKASKSAREPVGKTASKASAAKTTVAKSSTVRKQAPRAAAVAPMHVAPAATPIIRTASPPVQPIVVPEVPVRAHKYDVGETVYYTSPTFGRAAATGSYTVVKLLPSDGEDYQYRIKSSGEAFERVAKESQLDRA
jgi:hypothetical protein